MSGINDGISSMLIAFEKTLTIFLPGCSLDVDEPCLFPFVDAASGKTYDGCAQTPEMHTDTWCPITLGSDGVFRKEVDLHTRCLPETCGISEGVFIPQSSPELDYLHDIYLDHVQTHATLEMVSKNGGRALECWEQVTHC